MTWTGTLKALGMFLVVTAAVGTLVVGMVQLLFGRPWMRLGGFVMVVAAFLAVIFALDFMLGRPQAFSKDPLQRDPRRNPRGYQHH